TAFAPVFTVYGRELNLTATVGLALDDGADADHLLRKAGHVLNTAKRNGGNRVQTAHGAIDLDMGGDVSVGDLRRALERDELRGYYQPVVALNGSDTTGHEALLRWCHPTRGVLAPDSFLALLDETVLVHEVGAWVLRRACAETAARADSLDIAVNVST